MEEVRHHPKYRFSYTLIRNDRKGVTIQVHPDKSVVVKVPKYATYERVDKIIERRFPWILNQKEFFRRFEPLPTPKEYFLGESHKYLGRQYRLKFFKVTDEPCVKLSDGYFKVFTAQQVFSEILEVSLSRFKKHKLSCPKLRIQQMTKRWGSYSASNILRLNLNLVKVPKACIRYVVIHELCHAVHPNHSAKFYRLLRMQLPGWEKWKERLEHERL
jgi:predicted metal-dependent hydrolase